MVAPTAPTISYADRAKKGRSSAPIASSSSTSSAPPSKSASPPSSQPHTRPPSPPPNPSDKADKMNGHPPIKPNAWAAKKEQIVDTTNLREQQPRQNGTASSIPSGSSRPINGTPSSNPASSGSTNARTTPLPPLNDSLSWPEVSRQSSKESRSEKANEHTTTKKSDKTKRVPFPAQDQQTAMDVATAAASGSSNSSPRPSNRGRRLPDDGPPSRRGNPTSKRGSPLLPSSANATPPNTNTSPLRVNSSLPPPAKPPLVRPSPAKSHAVAGYRELNPPSDPASRVVFGSIGNDDEDGLGLSLSGMQLNPDQGGAEQRESTPAKQRTIGIGVNADEHGRRRGVARSSSGSTVTPEGHKWEFGTSSASPSRPTGLELETPSEWNPSVNVVYAVPYGYPPQPIPPPTQQGYYPRGNGNGNRRSSDVAYSGHYPNPPSGGRGRGRYNNSPNSRGQSYRGGYGRGRHHSTSYPPSPTYQPSPLYPPPQVPLDPYQMPPTFVQPYAPYPQLPPQAYAMPPPGTAMPPPLPMPISALPYPLDPTRWYLLGQIEYYFSIQNLCHDVFLRKQMDSRGWIPISLIASFNRVRQLTLDPAVVRDTMALSGLIEMRDDRVRLRHRKWEQWVFPDAIESDLQEEEDIPPSQPAEVVAESMDNAPQDPNLLQGTPQSQDSSSYVDESSEDDVVFVMSAENSERPALAPRVPTPVRMSSVIGLGFPAQGPPSSTS